MPPRKSWYKPTDLVDTRPTKYTGVMLFEDQYRAIVQLAEERQVNWHQLLRTWLDKALYGDK